MITLQSFQGEWTLSRTIQDTGTAGTGRFDGTARFSADAHGLLYREEGQLVLPGQGAFTAVRHYLWRQDGPLITVNFDDGRPFHQFDPAAPTPNATHLCINDTYRVAYDFGDWPRWTARWNITGPRKDYAMVSCYAPFAGAETFSKT